MANYSEIFTPKTLSTEDWDKCIKFAYGSGYIYNQYSEKRNQQDCSKHKHDNLIGKVAEIVVYNSIKPFKEISEPDFNIYERKNKSWKADMQLKDGLDIHVKAQDTEQGLRFGISWIFQWGDNSGYGGKDSIYADGANGWVCFTSVDESKKSGEILAIIRIDILKKCGLAYEDPKKPSLIGIKKAVYYNIENRKNIVSLGLNGLSGFIKQGKYKGD